MTLSVRSSVLAWVLSSGKGLATQFEGVAGDGGNGIVLGESSGVGGGL